MGMMGGPMPGQMMMGAGMMPNAQQWYNQTPYGQPNQMDPSKCFAQNLHNFTTAISAYGIGVSC